jgi:hypothetical protein
MQITNRSRALPTLFSLLLLGAAVRADDSKVGITITNDDTNDIMVTVYDMNTHPHSALLVNERIGGFSSVPISIATNSGGNGHLYWTATTAADKPQCSQNDSSSLSDGATVHVYGHSDCPLRLPANIAPR